MENAAMNSPKDEQILNKDDSITNKDGDNYLEKGEQSTDQNKPDQKQVLTGTHDNDNREPVPSTEEKPSKKDPETRKYVL